jgi:hypothetical protein
VNRFWTALCLGLLLAPLQAFAADTYPRLGGYLIGGPHDYWDPNYQKQIAKLDVAILAVYPNWGKSKGTNMTQVSKKLKELNPNIKVFLYVIPESMKWPAPVVWSEFADKVNQEKWWVYQNGSVGSLILSNFGRETYVLNLTNYAKKDAQGKRFNQWFAEYVTDEFVKPNPYIDGLFTDNVFWKPRTDGDWNMDGKIDKHDDKAVQKWYRDGYRTYFDTLKKTMPGKLQLANVADWGLANASAPEFQDQTQGGVIEGIFGKNYSLEKQNDGWKKTMAQYRKTMAMFSAPKIALFNQGGSSTDYQGMRYGLASCLMDDGYFNFNDEADGYHGVPWFDEFNVDLGKAVSKPQTTAWQKGVYRRDFEKGIALVNPKGNGAQEVTLEGDVTLIKGTQAPAVNTGATVRKVTLKDRDGIILIRKTPVKSISRPPAANFTATK